MIYVVVNENGEYSDYSMTLRFASTSLLKAEEFLKKSEEEIQKYNTACDEYVEWIKNYPNYNKLYLPSEEENKNIFYKANEKKVMELVDKYNLHGTEHLGEIKIWTYLHHNTSHYYIQEVPSD